MFQGSIVWRGVVYAILMTFAKMITGLWLVRFSPSPVSSLVSVIKKPFSYVTLFCAAPKTDAGKQKKKQKCRGKHRQFKSPSTGNPNQSDNNASADKQDENTEASSHDTTTQSESQTVPQNAPPNPNATISLPPKPKSLYPPSILGLAMVARGEVGYLIASLAESQGMFSDGSSGKTSEIYLVIIWAISICTLIGPISLGTLVKRVKKLQQMRENSGGPDPLGVWGI
jgi:hypothetical protein